MIKQLGLVLAISAIAACFASNEASHAGGQKVNMTIDEAKQLIAEQRLLDTIPKDVWRQMLTPDAFKVLWEKGTERPGSGKLLEVKEPGVFVSAGCRIPVFDTKHKFESGTGWPSFWDAVDKGNIILKPDNSWGMKRTEVLSACGEHLGHVFDDGPQPTGLRYCINSVALDFIPATPDGEDVSPK